MFPRTHSTSSTIRLYPRVFLHQRQRSSKVPPRPFIRFRPEKDWTFLVYRRPKINGSTMSKSLVSKSTTDIPNNHKNSSKEKLLKKNSVRPLSPVWYQAHLSTHTFLVPTWISTPPTFLRKPTTSILTGSCPHRQVVTTTTDMYLGIDTSEFLSLLSLSFLLHISNR